MATVFALEQGLVEAARHPNPPQYQGKLRILKGSFTTSATPGALGSGVITVNQNDVVILGIMHKDEQVMLSYLTVGAMGASATASIGTFSRAGNVFTAVSATRYLNALAVNAATQSSFASTDAQNFMDVQTLDQVYIGMTAGGANFANGQTMKIALLYVGD